MIEAKPYNLQLPEGKSDKYYAEIAAFAGRWLPHAMERAGELVSGFLKHRDVSALGLRSEAECAFELLALGVLLREHGHQAARLSHKSAKVLEHLAGLQQRLPWAERAIKRVRGLLGGFLRVWRKERGPVYTHPEDVERLIQWLEANGEPTQAERFAEWLAFFVDAYPPDQTRRAIRSCWQLAQEFAQESDAALGKYTREADAYSTGSSPKVHWRYDATLITRSRVEYHLGMLGTEILNRAYRPGYCSAGRRLVILPVCLRAQPGEKCQAVQTPRGAECAGCTPGCRVHQITQLGKKHGIPVVCVPDDELANLCVTSGQAGSGLGVLGVACALRNWSAGWEAQKLGLNAQGILLDFPGCKKHWRREGATTDTNVKKIEEMLLL